MVTPAASEVETRLPASPLQLWASPAQAKQTLYKSGGGSTRRALTYLGSHLDARESRPNRLAAAAAGVAGMQAGLWPALGKLWRGAGASACTNRRDRRFLLASLNLGGARGALEGIHARRRRRFFRHFFRAIFYLFSWEFAVLAAMLSRLATACRRC